MAKEKLISKIIKKYEALLGTDFKIDIAIVDNMFIDRNTGKFKVFISNIRR
jgi:hypothetical protein